MNLQREPVHQSRQLDSLVVESADQFRQFFLRRHDQPELASPLPSEVLHHSLQVKHFLHVTGDELSDLVDDEDQRLAGGTTLHQLQAAFGQQSRCNVGAADSRFAPTVHLRICSGLDFAHYATGLLHGESDFGFLDVPILAEDSGESIFEESQTTFGFERDLQLRQIEVAGIAQPLQKQAVHDFSDRLIAAADAAIGGYIEDDRLGGNLFVDVREQRLNFWIASTLAEELGCSVALDQAIFQRQPQHLGEAGFAGAEEARNPDADAFVRLIGRFAVAVENVSVVITDGIRNHIFFDFIADNLLVILVDLDDFFDSTGNSVSE